jgi:hypothetical protein
MNRRVVGVDNNENAEGLGAKPSRKRRRKGSGYLLEGEKKVGPVFLCAF